MTYQWGNNHGSLMQVNGQWYIFYHRQEGCDEYARQAMVEPVDIALGMRTARSISVRSLMRTASR